MDNELRIYCTNIGEYVDVEGGETLQHVYERIKGRIKIRPISVMVNNRDKHLAYPLYGPKHVEFIDRNTISGRRTYTRSLVMILHKASTNSTISSTVSKVRWPPALVKSTLSTLCLIKTVCYCCCPTPTTHRCQPRQVSTRKSTMRLWSAR